MHERLQCSNRVWLMMSKRGVFHLWARFFIYLFFFRFAFYPFSHPIRSTEGLLCLEIALCRLYFALYAQLCYDFCKSLLCKVLFVIRLDLFVSSGVYVWFKNNMQMTILVTLVQWGQDSTRVVPAASIASLCLVPEESLSSTIRKTIWTSK